MPINKRPSLAASIRERQKQGHFPVISELKPRSPKEGDLFRGRDPLTLVSEMGTCPVAGISVVTEPLHFGGSMDLLRDVMSHVSLPVLHKDFVTDPEQVKESAKAGASAILIITSMLDDAQIELLVEASRRHGIESLVEVHTASEMERVADLDYDLLGINNRDITVLEVDDMDVSWTETLAPLKGVDRPLISENSISGPEDIVRAGRAGADAALVGTAVLRAPDISQFLNQLIGVGWPV